LIVLATATGVLAFGLKSVGRKAGLRIVLLGALSLLAALAFRIAAGYAAESRTLLLGIAAALALAPLFIWAIAFFPAIADPDDRKEAEAPGEPVGSPVAGKDKAGKKMESPGHG